MTKNVITIDPETPLKTIENLLVEHNIGRLPVVAGNKLLGIVTRSDVISTLFGENSPSGIKELYDSQDSALRNHNLADKINALPERVKTFLLKPAK